MSQMHLTVAIVVALLAALGVICMLVSRVIARVGGWKRLVGRFSAEEPLPGHRFIQRSGGVGWVVYNDCLDIWISREGLGLSMSSPFRQKHPPLLIPWREIHVGEVQNVLGTEYVECQVGSPAVARLRMPPGVLDEAPDRHPPGAPGGA